MGNSSSKSVVVPKHSLNKNANKPSISASSDESFGREIMKNIKLKESPFISSQKEASKSSNLSKRMELDKRTEGTVSWNNFSFIFDENNSNRINLEKSKMDDIKKYFEIPKKVNKS